MGKPFNYGGQAVIEGVMMRGSRTMAVAVRSPEGQIVVQEKPLNEKIYNGPISRIPFVRGLVILWDTLGLGIQALMMSAEIAGEASFSGPAAWGTLAGAFGVAIGLFILLPSFLVGLVASYLPSEWLVGLLEGIVRLFLIVCYVWVIGFFPDVRRVFAYHGAEHKTVHAHEAGVALTVEEVRRFSMAHPRCGTAFLLTLVLLAVLIFAPLGTPSLAVRVISRIVLLPLIAGIAYEFVRLTARLANRPWARVVIVPNLALQRLTTREPDDEMLEVAIAAMKAVLASEYGQMANGGLVLSRD